MDEQSDLYMTEGDTAAVLTRVELAMIRAIEAFNRWAFFLHKGVGGPQLAPQDIFLLHSIRMRGGAQNLSELLLFLNRNDVSTLQYSLKKIEQFGLIQRVTGNSKREAGYRLTGAGMTLTEDYAQVRQELLIALVGDVKNLSVALEGAAGALERLTGLYDQSTQAVLNRKIMGPR
ncbi:MAG: winged helix DNA-binding protein [Sphingomonadaceae bacterium]|nr:winged helix DNA-binding protein [Sphingomonadaceae bacterium]